METRGDGRGVVVGCWGGCAVCRFNFSPTYSDVFPFLRFADLSFFTSLAWWRSLTEGSRLIFSLHRARNKKREKPIDLVDPRNAELRAMFQKVEFVDLAGGDVVDLDADARAGKREKKGKDEFVAISDTESERSRRGFDSD